MGENNRRAFPTHVRNLPSRAPENRIGEDGTAESWEPCFCPVTASSSSTWRCAGVGVRMPAFPAALRSSGVIHAEARLCVSVKSRNVGHTAWAFRYFSYPSLRRSTSTRAFASSGAGSAPCEPASGKGAIASASATLRNRFLTLPCADRDDIFALHRHYRRNGPPAEGRKSRDGNLLQTCYASNGVITEKMNYVACPRASAPLPPQTALPFH